MTGTCFADTNLLVYARDTSEPEKQARAQEWLTHLWKSRVGRTSVQVLNEYYWVVTHKLSTTVPCEDARQDIRDLSAWDPVWLDEELVRRAWVVEDRYQLAFWDALIVAATQSAGCRYLLTDDLTHGQELGGVEVVDPFQSDPSALD
jgi:predicted nucleic acid-binding protein